MRMFKGMTFARAMILLCLLGSVVLGYYDVQEFNQIREERKALLPRGTIEILVRRIQQNSKLYSELYKKKGEEGLGQDDPTVYITKIATDPKIIIGRVDVNAKEKILSQGMVDKIFTISPYNKEIPYTLTHIANFLWSLEDRSRRVRVTDFKIEALNDSNKPRVKNSEMPSEFWSFSCQVTSRERRGG